MAQRIRRARPRHRPAVPPQPAGPLVTAAGWSVCRDCHRPLTDPESQAIGYGRDCARKRGIRRPRARRRAPRPRPVTVPHPPDTVPGQDALPLFEHQPTLWSL
ncbi:DUF6011 domain-containing protein [Streptomyces sp. NPDC008150]|uniref:DUF6011 domain-containing protein n=1 Tax=Streptomyces sp. NPDC008150 TaxID=3364816 RepID=UPI0036E5F2DF